MAVTLDPRFTGQTEAELAEELRAWQAGVDAAMARVKAKAWMEKYSEDQERDDHGRFSSSGGGGGGEDARPTGKGFYRADGYRWELWGDKTDGYLARVNDHGDRGMWGASHGGSQAITGASAYQMSIEGYRDMEYEGSRAGSIAEGFLQDIADGNEVLQSDEKYYHGQLNKSEELPEVGSTMRLPLMALEEDAESAIGYGLGGREFDNPGPPERYIVYEVGEGTKVMGYSRTTVEGRAEFEIGRFQEAITAGEFKVTAVGPGPTYGWKDVPSTKISLEQTKVFSPKTGWPK